MDFQNEKYAKGATGYDQRIRNTFPFYETIHPAMNAMLRGLVRSDGNSDCGKVRERIWNWQTNPIGDSGENRHSPCWICAKKNRSRGLAERTSFFKGYVDELPIGTLYDGATLGMVLHGCR